MTFIIHRETINDDRLKKAFIPVYLRLLLYYTIYHKAKTPSISHIEKGLPRRNQ